MNLKYLKHKEVDVPEISINRDMPSSVGYYAPRENKVFIGTPHVRAEPDWGTVRVEMSEDNWVNVLCHELTHWAQYAYCEPDDIEKLSISYTIYPHKKNIIERAMLPEYQSENTPLVIVETIIPRYSDVVKNGKRRNKKNNAIQ